MAVDISNKLAEENLISCLFYKPDKIVEVFDKLNPEIFYNRDYANIYKCLVELYKENIIPDEVTVLNKARSLNIDIMPDLVKKLYNNTTFVTKKQLREYTKIIQSSAFKRKTLSLCSDFMENAREMSDPDKIVNDFISLGISLSDKIKMSNHISPIDVDKKALMNDIDFRYNNPDTITGIPFGFPTIDKFIDGAKDGYIYTLCGHNGHCKSLFSQVVMLNMAIWLKKQEDDRKIVCFSLEMTRQQIEERFLSVISGINGKYFRNPRLYFEDMKIEDNAENYQKFKDKILKATEILNQLPIVIDDSSDLTAMQVIATVKKYQLKYGVACVFVDYAGLLINDEMNEEHQNISKTYSVFKRTAKDMGIPFIVLNQYLKSFTPNPKNANRGSLFDMAGGKATLNDSHVVMHVLFPQQCKEFIEKHPEYLNKVIVFADKIRDGVYGIMPDVMLDFKNGRLVESRQIALETQAIVDEVSKIEV